MKPSKQPRLPLLTHKGVTNPPRIPKSRAVGRPRKPDRTVQLYVGLRPDEARALAAFVEQSGMPGSSAGLRAIVVPFLRSEGLLGPVTNLEKR